MWAGSGPSGSPCSSGRAPAWIRRRCSRLITGCWLTSPALGVNSIPNRARSRSVTESPPWLAGAPDAEQHSWAAASNPARCQISRASTSANGSPVARSISQDSTKVLTLVYSYTSPGAVPLPGSRGAALAPATGRRPPAEAGLEAVERVGGVVVCAGRVDLEAVDARRHTQHVGAADPRPARPG